MNLYSRPLSLTYARRAGPSGLPPRPGYAAATLSLRRRLTVAFRRAAGCTVRRRGPAAIPAGEIIEMRWVQVEFVVGLRCPCDRCHGLGTVTVKITGKYYTRRLSDDISVSARRATGDPPESRAATIDRLNRPGFGGHTARECRSIWLAVNPALPASPPSTAIQPTRHPLAGERRAWSETRRRPARQRAMGRRGQSASIGAIPSA